MKPRYIRPWRRGETEHLPADLDNAIAKFLEYHCIGWCNAAKPVVISGNHVICHEIVMHENYKRPKGTPPREDVALTRRRKVRVRRPLDAFMETS